MASRWGRHWLDVARYADSNGLDENIAHGTAWRYRDYVVSSINADKPFDRFITEQIAGDLLEFTSDDERHQFLIATGFLSIGPKVLAEVNQPKMHGHRGRADRYVRPDFPRNDIWVCSVS